MNQPVQRATVITHRRPNDIASAVTELRNFKKNFPNSPLINTVDVWLPEWEKRLSASK